MINRDDIAEQRDAMWARLLTSWQANGLPTPISIDVRTASASVRLPANERGQVDAWAGALGLRPATIGDPADPLSDGFRQYVMYGAHSDDLSVAALCQVDLGVADDHWSAPGPAVSAALLLAAMLTPDSPDLPADLPTGSDGFVPRLSDGGTWAIGDGDRCPFYYGSDPVEVVASHDNAIAAMADLTARIAPPAQSTTWQLGDPEPTGVLQVASSNADLWDFDEETGRWSHPCDDGSGMSITVVWDDLLHDGPLVQTLPTPPAVDSPTVSTERGGGETANDGCSPLLRTDDGCWSIGGGSRCRAFPLVQETREEAIAAHNLMLVEAERCDDCEGTGQNCAAHRWSVKS